MRLANSRLVAQMQRRIVDGFYGDSASVLQDTVTSLDANGQPNVTTTTTAISCNFTNIGGAQGLEKWKGYADISQIAAELRYEGSPVPAKGNRVTLTGRFDSTDYVDQTFEIIGIQDRDALGYVCALMLAEI